MSNQCKTCKHRHQTYIHTVITYIKPNKKATQNLYETNKHIYKTCSKTYIKPMQTYIKPIQAYINHKINI